jgi:hypothetical protein
MLLYAFATKLLTKDLQKDRCHKDPTIGQDRIHSLSARNVDKRVYLKIDDVSNFG